MPAHNESAVAPTIETPRLLLRPWRDSDVEPWAAMCADPRVMATLGPLKDRAEAGDFAATQAARLERNGYGWWVASVKHGRPFIGIIALQDVPLDLPFAPALEVGWRLVAEAWGNGYATEGGRAALAFAFAELARSEVVALTAKINVASQRVMQRLGMARDAAGDFQHPRIAEGAALRPHVLYRIRSTSA